MGEFIQIIRFKTDLEVDRMSKMNEEYRKSTEGRSTYTSAVVGRDLDTDEYVIGVTFPCKEAADANNDLPETAANAEEMAKHPTQLPSFSNIAVIERN